MLQKIRRVVTGHKDGKAAIMISDLAPNATEVKGWKGLGITGLWVTGETPVDNAQWGADQGARPMRHGPTPNGTIFRVVEFPPVRRRDRHQDRLRGDGSHNKPRAEDSAKASLDAQDQLDRLSCGHRGRNVDGLWRKARFCWGRATASCSAAPAAWVNKSDKPCLLAAILIDSVPA